MDGVATNLQYTPRDEVPMTSKLVKLLALAVLVVCVSATNAVAIPILQLYIPGGTYNLGNETWEPTSTGPLTLWAVGNISGSGGAGTISGVQLVIGYATGLTPIFTFTAATAGYGGYQPIGSPVIPLSAVKTESGTQPLMGDGSLLPSHGEYGSGVTWQQFDLGNFSDDTQSGCGDFIDTNGGTNVPAPTGTTGCQINGYLIGVSGLSADAVFHFDLFDHVAAQNSGKAKAVKIDTNKYVFAPFSHDADYQQTPEPGTLGLLAAGFLGLGALHRRSRRS